MRGRLKNWLLAMKVYRREKPAVFAVYFILRFIVIAALVLACINGDWDSAFMCVLVLVLFLIPSLIQNNFPISFPSTLEIIILLFIFAAEILGELSDYYVRYAHWDTLLHTTWGFLCAAVGFSLVDILNRSENIKFQLSPIYLAICAFCFSMTIGVVWEFFEFSVDVLFQKDMQKDTIIHAFSSVSLDPTLSNIPIRVENITSVAINGQELGLGGYLDIGLYDTMEDLFVNFIGALTFSIIGYFHVKSRGGSKFASRFIPQTSDTALRSAAETESGGDSQEEPCRESDKI